MSNWSLWLIFKQNSLIKPILSVLWTLSNWSIPFNILKIALSRKLIDSIYWWNVLNCFYYTWLVIDQTFSKDMLRTLKYNDLFIFWPKDLMIPEKSCRFQMTTLDWIHPVSWLNVNWSAIDRNNKQREYLSILDDSYRKPETPLNFVWSN